MCLGKDINDTETSSINDLALKKIVKKWKL